MVEHMFVDCLWRVDGHQVRCLGVFYRESFIESGRITVFFFSDVLELRTWDRMFGDCALVRGPQTLAMILIFGDWCPSEGSSNLGMIFGDWCPSEGSSNYGDDRRIGALSRGPRAVYGYGYRYGYDMSSRILEGHDTCHCLELIYCFTGFMHYYTAVC